jgi:hypothetical protein
METLVREIFPAIPSAQKGTANIHKLLEVKKK